MSTKLDNQVRSLAATLAANRLCKSAADQTIEHETVLSQNSLGAEQTQEIRDGQYVANADTEEARNESKEKVDEYPAAIQPLNRSAEAALSATGTSVNDIAPNGDSTGTPAEQAKTASYRDRLAGILAMSKQASAKQAPVKQAEPEIMTGTEVMSKIASLTSTSPKAEFDAARESLVKLASTNPVFQICKERIMMEKMAADMAELAANEGISPEEAAAELDAAQEANPEMAQELEDEATDEAIADTADIESAAAELGPGVEQLAANASEALGVEVTPDDILQAADEVTAQAEELGVEPEVLIQAAMEQMQGAGAEAEGEPTEEDMANAQQILDAAAEQGISPEEVIQMAAGELGGEEVPADVPAKAPEEAPVEKQAAAKPRYMSKRAAYCAYIRSKR